MTFQDTTFRRQVVHLDGNEFRRCRFEACQITYAATAPVVVRGCAFDKDCTFSLEGAAENTIRYLQGVYAGVRPNGQGFVDALFATIREGGTLPEKPKGLTVNPPAEAVPTLPSPL